MGLFTKMFGTYSERQIKHLNSTVNEIEALADKYAAMTDGELRSVTELLKGRLADGETLDDILPDAFAAVREAADRVLGKRPFRVQLIGGIVLHQGRIAEMKTGEGKTLVAVLPAYLNALAGNGVHIVTVNEYLARVGSEEMGRVYGFMGMTTGLIIHDQTKEEKKEAYGCDITYGTNNEFGFDYLRDNMVIYKDRKVQRGHAFAIVDEVDSILIDEARTPLIISGAGEEATDIYQKACKFARSLKEFRIKEMDSKILDEGIESEYDYTVDEKARSTVLTAAGVKKAEKFFGIENLSDPENAIITHHINQAIRARAIMIRDDDYIVDKGKVIIVDSFTGRLMPGRRYSDGLHQAIEAKENVKIQKESKTLATITFQNYFRLYKKLSGMTGTALTEEMEFREIYELDVVEIPTNKPMIRIDHRDRVYGTVEAKYKAICNQIKECHEKGQPVLVGTVSVDKSELLSKMLGKIGIPHKVLNAKQHEREAEIVAEAGKLGSVTIATNMAGRGTDIMLGGNAEHLAKQEMRKMTDPETGFPLYTEELIGAAVGSSLNVSDEVLAARKVFRELYERHKAVIEPLAEQVKEAGGLFIVGTERHESRRIDNQLRGRAGRQGDPGESRFFIALEDDLMRLFGSERVIGMVQKLGIGDDAIEAGILSGAIEKAQRQLEGHNFQRRKNVLSYDDIMNEQRKIIYKQRDEVLDGADLSEKIKGMIESTIKGAVSELLPEDEREAWRLDELRARFLGLLCGINDFKYSEEELEEIEPSDIEAELLNRAEKLYNQKQELFGENLKEVERVILLKNVDSKWIDHIDAVDDIKGGIGLHAYAQRNPINEFRIVSADMFDEMINDIKVSTVKQLLSAVPAATIERREVAKVTGDNFTDPSKAEKKRPTVNKQNGVAKNAPCPCGSGKKFKRCCGKDLFKDER
ncbi:MAG: preprotein translocase subunit SecA [Clostridia bacterium]|nr:preprotein translocase subunit SecA [Clostridia bacterium]